MDNQSIFQMRLNRAYAILATAGLSSPYARIERALRSIGAKVPPVLFMSSLKRFWFLFLTTLTYMLPLMLTGTVWASISLAVALVMALGASFVAAALTSMYFEHVRAIHKLPLWDALL
jgi:Family of unknown function (DUF6404)